MSEEPYCEEDVFVLFMDNETFRKYVERLELEIDYGKNDI